MVIVLRCCYWKYRGIVEKHRDTINIYIIVLYWCTICNHGMMGSNVAQFSQIWTLYKILFFMF